MFFRVWLSYLGIEKIRRKAFARPPLLSSTTVSQVGRRQWCGFLNTLNAASFTLNADVCLFDPLLGIIQIILFSSLKMHQTGLQNSSATFCYSTVSLKALNVMVK